MKNNIFIFLLLLTTLTACGQKKMEQKFFTWENNLQKISNRYFTLLSKYAVVTGSNKKDYFTIRSLNNNDIEVTIQRKKNDTILAPYFTAIYKAKITNEIWIYGLDDNDVFVC